MVKFKKFLDSHLIVVSPTSGVLLEVVGFGFKGQGLEKAYQDSILWGGLLEELMKFAEGLTMFDPQSFVAHRF